MSVPLVLPALWILLGCGDLGLVVTPAEPVAASPGTSPGQSSEGGGSDDAGTSSDEEQVRGSLEGNTWALDLATVTFVEPPGLASVLSLMESTVLLFHATDESTDELDMVVTLAAADGQQDPCQRVQALPDADWLNPVFAIDEGVLELSISGAPVAFRDTVLSATVEPDGRGWHDGVLLGTLDARDLEAAFPEGTDVCNLVEAMGSACGRCDDGAAQCFELHLDDIAATEAPGRFDTSPDGC